jgi:hypothetical protein
LVGCGGGSGGGVSSVSKVTGAVIDGYLKGAIVCLDMNSNLKCDGDAEYQTTSGANGAYVLNVPAGVDVSKYHVLAEVGTNAIDSDTNAPPPMPYTLLAPAVDAAVVTPLTTFVSHTMIDKSALTLDEAKAQTLTTLNLPASTKLNQDYVAASDASTHRVATMAAAVLGQVQTDVLTAVVPTSDAQKREALKVALKQSLATVASYSQAAASATSDSTLSSIKDAAKKSAKDDVAADSSLKDNVQKQADLGVAKVATVADILKNGLFDFWPSNSFDGAGALKEGLTYEVINSEDGVKVKFGNYFTFKTDAAWVPSGYGSSGPTSAANSATTFYAEYTASESKGAWVDTTKPGTGTWASAGDGTTGTYTDDVTGQTIKISMATIDVGGKKASQVPHLLSNRDGYCGWDSTANARKPCADWTDFTFSTGAQVVAGTFYRNQDQYRVSDCSGCGVFSESSYDSTTKQTTYSFPVATIDAVIARATPSNPVFSNLVWFDKTPALFTKVSDTAGTVSFRTWNQSTNKYDTVVGSGVYEVSTVAGKKVMVVKVTSEVKPGQLISATESSGSGTVHSFNGRALLVEWDNKVLDGRVYLKGLNSSGSERPSLNRIAADDFLKAQGYPVTK